MNRRKFLGLSSAATASLFTPDTLRAADDKNAIRPFKLENDHFSLDVTFDANGANFSLIHKPSKTVLANGPYSYPDGVPHFEKLGSPITDSAILTGTTPSGLNFVHDLRLKDNWLDETLIITNTGKNVYEGKPRFGFTLPATPDTLADYKFTAVPFRREPSGVNGEYADYTLANILKDKRPSKLMGSLERRDLPMQNSVVCTDAGWDWQKPPLLFEVYAAEGWAATNGTTGFLFTKYNPRAMEWAVLDASTVNGAPALRWGGAGIYVGNPEPACRLLPGESFTFGTTRLTPFQGGLTEGYYTFRAEMEARGHRVPHGFNAPLHWNELYDNKLWWLPNNEWAEPEQRQKLYRLPDMEEAAAKAKAIGVEALYMDPGWDTTFASKYWDESRLGRCAEYVALMKHKYGLKVSLHTPLSGWCDPTAYSFETCRLDENGVRNRLSLCGASNQYVEETARRLNILADAGVTFFMFDGTVYSGPCHDTQHGHPRPSRGHDHTLATDRIARLVHEKHPDVQIEMHDQILGGCQAHYVPMYFGYGKAPEGKSSALGFDTAWAFELMWDPMTNLGKGNSIALYYYSLAYSQPLYLHIDLRTDNANAVMFWWNASTCRHLGIGGTHKDEAVRAVQKQAVTDYIRLKPHFASGTFYGIDEVTHVHRHPTASTAVINAFNLTQAAVTRTITFDPKKYNLAPGKSYKFTSADFSAVNGVYTASITIPPMGHHLIEVS